LVPHECDGHPVGGVPTPDFILEGPPASPPYPAFLRCRPIGDVALRPGRLFCNGVETVSPWLELVASSSVLGMLGVSVIRINALMLRAILSVAT
jgi:hypothetical protein